MMIEAAIPANEAQRLETLRALQILDTDPEERFDRLTRLAKRVFDVPTAMVVLIDQERGWIKSVQGHCKDTFDRHGSFCGHAISSESLFVVEDALRDARFINSPMVLDDPHVRFYAGYPLKADNGLCMGTLCILDQKPRVFSDEEQQLMNDLGHMAEKEIAALQLATLDELTRCSNRRGFVTLADHALNMCYRSQSPASLVMFDLDDFKPINDRYGHAEGDRALVTFSNCIRRQLRDSDVFGRIGGDEFVALLTGTGEEGIGAALERFSGALEHCNLASKRDYKIRYSAGYAIRAAGSRQPVLDLMHIADTNMYLHKRSRRH